MLRKKQAAARLKDLRNDICEALAKIPLLLTNTKIINGVFKKSKELHKCSSTLYVKTLATLEHIVTWYKQKAASMLTRCNPINETYKN